jgi:hypothetical protein
MLNLTAAPVGILADQLENLKGSRIKSTRWVEHRPDYYPVAMGLAYSLLREVYPPVTSFYSRVRSRPVGQSRAYYRRKCWHR